MAELWPMMEFNPIKFNNPTQSWGGKKLDPRLDPLNVKKSSEKKSPPKFEMRNGKVTGF